MGIRCIDTVNSHLQLFWKQWNSELKHTLLQFQSSQYAYYLKLINNVVYASLRPIYKNSVFLLTIILKQLKKGEGVSMPRVSEAVWIKKCFYENIEKPIHVHYTI